MCGRFDVKLFGRQTFGRHIVWWYRDGTSWRGDVAEWRYSPRWHFVGVSNIWRVICRKSQICIPNVYLAPPPSGATPLEFHQDLWRGKLFVKRRKYFIPTCIWRPHWGWPHWNYTEIFGVARESRLYHAALFSRWCFAVLIEHRLVTDRQTDRRTDGHTDKRTKGHNPYLAINSVLFNRVTPKNKEGSIWIIGYMHAKTCRQNSVSPKCRRHVAQTFYPRHPNAWRPLINVTLLANGDDMTLLH